MKNEKCPSDLERSPSGYRRGKIKSDYPRYLTPQFETFDPLELARRTESIVCQGDKRKYTSFYATGVYGGIATGYTVGCCLRCIFCWVDWSRDFPEERGDFYSPSEVFQRLDEAARLYHTRKLRISGAEPTLGKVHLLGLLDYVEHSPYELFILETNGVPFGADPGYVKSLKPFSKIHVRVSIKAGNSQSFQLKTGARGDSFGLPFEAIRNLLRYGISFHVASMTADPRIVSPEERRELVEKLASIDKRLLYNLEEEVVDPYDTTLARLRYAGRSLNFPLREIYSPLRGKG